MVIISYVFFRLLFLVPHYHYAMENADVCYVGLSADIEIRKYLGFRLLWRARRRPCYKEHLTKYYNMYAYIIP